MMSRYWLALVLFQLAAAAPAAEAGAGLDGSIPVARGAVAERATGEPFYPGTSVNSPSLGGPRPDQRILTDYQQALSDPTKQPELPSYNGCSFAYVHQSQGGELPIWETGASPLVDLDVAQGAIGDCGFGSAVNAIILNGHTKYLQDRLKVNGSTYEFTFTINGVDQVVAVDDQLPALSAGPSTCWTYLGYKPAGPSKSAYVPLLEKALAKLLDARPDLKANSEGPKGYLGLEAVWSHWVLSMLTGKGAVMISRPQGAYGLAPNLVAAIEKCLTVDIPCVIGTPNSTDSLVYPLGPQQVAGEWDVPQGEDYVSAVFTPVLDNPKQKDYFHILDHDLKDAYNTVVPRHAWAIDRVHSTYTPGGDIRQAVVRLINPWGYLPKPWTQLDAPNALDLSFPALASLITHLYTLQSI